MKQSVLTLSLSLAAAFFLSGCSVTINTNQAPQDTPDLPADAEMEEVSSAREANQQDQSARDTEAVLQAESPIAESEVAKGRDSESVEIQQPTEAEDKPADSAEMDRGSEDTSGMQVTARTVHFPVVDEEGNELYDLYTIAFIDPETGKQIRKFPRGDMLTFSGIAPGTYTISVSPVIRAGETSTPYAGQSFTYTLGNDTNDIEVIQIVAEKK